MERLEQQCEQASVRSVRLRAMRTFAMAMLLAAAAAAQEQDFSKVEVTATRVAGNVFFLKGAGGNALFSDTAAILAQTNVRKRLIVVLAAWEPTWGGKGKFVSADDFIGTIARDLVK
jgi:hypothetical protein